jgi:phosphoribosylformylglycinamidine synthase
MGLVIGEKDMDILQRIADRERSPMYEVGVVTNDHRFTFESKTTGLKPIGLRFGRLFRKFTKTIMTDTTIDIIQFRI